MKYQQDTEVRVSHGQLEGYVGRVSGYDPLFEMYMVTLPDLAHAVLSFDEEELEALGENKNDRNEPEMADVPDFGMSSEALAQYTSEFVNRCVTRILTVGHDQYDQGGHQRFEAHSIADVCQMALEEIEDLAVYAAMLHIKLRRTLAAVEEVL
jgi:hypothetical protein